MSLEKVEELSIRSVLFTKNSQGAVQSSGLPSQTLLSRFHLLSKAILSSPDVFRSSWLQIRQMGSKFQRRVQKETKQREGVLIDCYFALDIPEFAMVLFKEMKGYPLVIFWDHFGVFVFDFILLTCRLADVTPGGCLLFTFGSKESTVFISEGILVRSWVGFRFVATVRIFFTVFSFHAITEIKRIHVDRGHDRIVFCTVLQFPLLS